MAVIEDDEEVPVAWSIPVAGEARCPRRRERTLRQHRNQDEEVSKSDTGDAGGDSVVDNDDDDHDHFVQRRIVDESCAICLADYAVGDALSWSSNPQCHHVFHRECIQNWLLRKCAYPTKSCPCCRQPFVIRKLKTA